MFLACLKNQLLPAWDRTWNTVQLASLVSLEGTKQFMEYR